MDYDTKFDRYRTPEELKPEIKKLHEQDNWHGSLAVLEDWSVIFGTIILCEFAPGLVTGLVSHTSLCITSTLLYIISLFILGSRHRALATLLHESSHETIAKNKKLNYLIGTVFGGWAIGQSRAVYRKSHVKDHHAHLGDEKKDPDYQAMLDTGLYSDKMSRSELHQYLWGIISPRQTLVYWKYLIVNRIWSKWEPWAEFIPRMLYVVTIVTAVTATGNGLRFLKYWVLPMLTTANWVGSLIELAEHYPLIKVKPENNELYMSRNRLHISRITYFFLGMHEESWHLVHHIFPRMPFYHQEEAHNILMQDPKYAAVQRTSGWLGIIEEMGTLAEEKKYPQKPILRKRSRDDEFDREVLAGNGEPAADSRQGREPATDFRSFTGREPADDAAAASN